MEGVATKDDSAAILESEILLNDILDGDAVGATFYGIGAEHMERAFVIERSADTTTTIERDVVVGFGIHQDTQRALWRRVDIEVDIDIRGRSKVLLRFFAMTRAHTRMIHPGDELLFADGVGVCGVISKYRFRLGCHVTVDNHLARTSVEVGSTRGIDRSADDAAIEIVEIIS